MHMSINTDDKISLLDQSCIFSLNCTDFTQRNKAKWVVATEEVRKVLKGHAANSPVINR